MKNKSLNCLLLAALALLLALPGCNQQEEPVQAQPQPAPAQPEPAKPEPAPQEQAKEAEVKKESKKKTTKRGKSAGTRKKVRKTTSTSQ